MYRGIFLLVACLAATVYGNVIVPEVPMPDGRIVGGEATTIEKFPYQVSVRMLGSHICGGSIINDQVVLTAAHCIYDVSPSYYSIAFGSSNVNEGTQITAKRLLKHPKYDSRLINFDIALIFLQDSIPVSAVSRPIKLASKQPKAGTKAVVSGWGVTRENGVIANILQQVAIQIVDHDVCKEQYAGVNPITSNMICAGVPEGGKDACQGDSGGPLVANSELVGIVSWGVGCARPGISGVYTNVAKLKPWVDENLA